MSWLDKVFSAIGQRGYGKDSEGRPVIPIYSETALQDFLDRPEQLPAGALHFYSTIPLGPLHTALLAACAKREPNGPANYGLTGPFPETIQTDLQQRLGTAIERLFLTAADLPKASLEILLNRASLATDDGFLTIPAFAGDPTIGRALSEALDIHKFEECPLERWLKEDLEMLLPAVARELEMSVEALRPLIALKCQGGVVGLNPTLCKVTQHPPAAPGGPEYTVTISHGFFYICLVAIKSCAIRARLATAPRNEKISAKEINDSLRDAISWYLQGGQVPPINAVAHQLEPHQLVIADRLSRGLRRFSLAHELGHILLWKAKGGLAHFQTALGATADAMVRLTPPEEYVDAWATEMTCDLLAIKLLQESISYGRPEKDKYSEESLLAQCWDYAGAQLLLTWWTFLLEMREKAGGGLPQSHPPGTVRKLFLETSYPSWIRNVGDVNSQTFDYRLRHLWPA